MVSHLLALAVHPVVPEAEQSEDLVVYVRFHHGLESLGRPGEVLLPYVLNKPFHSPGPRHHVPAAAVLNLQRSLGNLPSLVLASDQAAATTGTTLTVDGGVAGAFPR